MIWKVIQSAILLTLMVISVILLRNIGINGPLHYSSRVVIQSVFAVISTSFGIVGIVKMHRGGHGKVSRILVLCNVILIFFSFMLIMSGGFSVNWFFAVFVLFAVPFPIALYLNRRQNKSNSDLTNADAE